MTGGNGSNGALQSPFALYYVVTFSLNSVAIIGGVMSELDLHRGQNYWYNYDRCDAWLFANACFGVIHILAAMYLVKKIRQPLPVNSTDYQLQVANGNGGYYPQTTLPQNTTQVVGEPDSWKRIKHVLCENSIWAMYLLVFFVYLCWHFFLEMRACNVGMSFAMRCADIFIAD